MKVVLLRQKHVSSNSVTSCLLWTLFSIPPRSQYLRFGSKELRYSQYQSKQAACHADVHPKNRRTCLDDVLTFKILSLCVPLMHRRKATDRARLLCLFAILTCECLFPQCAWNRVRGICVYTACPWCKLFRRSCSSRRTGET